MAGALVQLVAKGNQDIVLTGKPTITFFRLLHKRHTNFSMESVEQSFSSNVGWGKKSNSILTRGGDLITKCYLYLTLPKLEGKDEDGCYYAWTPEVGHAVIKCYRIRIGGNVIDEQFGEWLHIWKELTLPSGKRDGYNEMIGNTTELTSFGEDFLCKDETVLIVPLQFWFCREPELALPLISLQHHDVRLEVEFRNKEEVVVKSRFDAEANNGCGEWSAPEAPDKLALKCVEQLDAVPYVDLVYLTNKERRRFALNDHEYLIEQLQVTDETITSTTDKVKFQFSHPSKFLVWGIQHENVLAANQHFNYTNRAFRLVGDQCSGTYEASGKNFVLEAKLLLNTSERLSRRCGLYFNNVQPYQHFTNIPEKGINVYSFALNPMDNQPSGTVNFSRIDHTTIELELRKFEVWDSACQEFVELDPGSKTLTASAVIFTLSYNILKFISGMAGIGYSS